MEKINLVVGSSDQEIDELNQWEREEYTGLSARRSKHSKHLPFFITILFKHYGEKPFKTRDVKDFLIEARDVEGTNLDFYSSKTFYDSDNRLSDLSQRGIVERTRSLHHGYWYRFVPESVRELGF